MHNFVAQIRKINKHPIHEILVSVLLILQWCGALGSLNFIHGGEET